MKILFKLLSICVDRVTNVILAICHALPVSCDVILHCQSFSYITVQCCSALLAHAHPTIFCIPLIMFTSILGEWVTMTVASASELLLVPFSLSMMTTHSCLESDSSLWISQHYLDFVTVSTFMNAHAFNTVDDHLSTVNGCIRSPILVLQLSLASFRFSSFHSCCPWMTCS